MPTPTVSFRKIPTFVTQRQRAGQKALAKGRELGHRSENSRGGVFGPELYPPRPRWLTRIFTPSMFTRSLRLFVSRPSATGYLPPFDDFRKPPSERLLCSETCHLIIRTTIVRFGSDPAVPSRRDLRGHRPHRARHWTVDAVLSKAGRKHLLTKPHHRGARRCPGRSQSLTLPPGAPGSAACQGFLAVRLKPAPLLDSWCPARLCGDGCFPLAEHASQTSLKTITFLLKAAPLLGLRRIQT